VHAPPGMFDPLRDRDPVEVGGYRLRARLGSGGMGEVFLSFDRAARPVAVKVLRGELADDRQFRARFAQEVRSARRVRGEGIAPLVDADPEAESPWLATEYIAGPTLADAIELYGPLPVSSVLVLMAGIAGALGAIHESGIVHRDLKPPNVVLGADGLRVIDFGIARAADATPLTLTGMLVGSPQYVAPEQALGLPPSPAGDIFSLGALAHYAATGRPAYGEGPRIAVLYRIVNERPDLAGCPRQLRSLIASCLERDPADRPSTAEIVELCTPPDDPPHSASDWLPPAVVHAIDAYRATLADLTPTAVTDARVDAEATTQADTGPPTASSEPPGPDVVLAGSGSRGKLALSHRIQHSALAVVATLAVLAAGVTVALNIPSSGGSTSGSVAAFGATSPSGPGASFGTGTGQSSPLAWGPPRISGLGPPPGPPPGGPPPAGGPPGGGPGLGPAPTPTTLWWSGTVRFSSQGLWLDATPPSPAAGHGDIRESAPAPADEISSGAPQIQNLARWTGAGTPTGAQCQALALAQGTWELHVSAGDTVCALTAYRQIAVLHIESFPTDDSGVTASATVWGITPH
jgi:serine/threonine protein kinase